MVVIVFSNKRNTFISQHRSTRITYTLVQSKCYCTLLIRTGILRERKIIEATSGMTRGNIGK